MGKSNNNNGSAEIQQHTSSESQPTWNAGKLVKEYVKIAWCLEHCQTQSFKSLTWPNQIRVKRVAAALSAFMETKYDESNPAKWIDSVFSWMNYDSLFAFSELEDADHKQLLNLMREAMTDDRKFQSIIQFYHQRNNVYEKAHSQVDRSHMLRSLLEFRIKTEKLLSEFNGVMEASPGGILAIYAIKGLYFPSLTQNNEKVDEMIGLLLGKKLC